jgi:aminoglycoside phosphotransferase (APT) family kinase protein
MQTTDKSRPGLIPTPDEIDARWLRDALADAGRDFRPIGVTVAPVGTGQLAETYRLVLNYDKAGRSGPSSMICKLAASDENSRTTAKHWSLYEREVRFYQDLAAAARIDTPEYFAGGMSPDGRFFLLLEDLAPASVGDQFRGMETADARRAMREIARLHAATWGHGDRPGLEWLETGRLAQAFYAPEVFRSLWPQFRERYRDRLSDDQIKICDAFSEKYDSYSQPLARPRCVTHNDFRPDNMLYGAPGSDRLSVVDWQSAGLGFNAVDVAYMIGGAFEPEKRRTLEAELLKHYHEELVRQGVSGYSVADVQQDYRHFAFAGINVSVCAAVLVKRTERGDRMFLTMLDRHVRHVIDANSIALLDDIG